MKQYEVYVNPQLQYEAVKVGFSFPAFFFAGIWTLFKRMWNIATMVFGGFFVLGIFLGMAGVSEQVTSTIINVASLCLSVFFGINGNKLRISNLISRGYNYKDTVTASNPEGAISLAIQNKG